MTQDPPTRPQQLLLQAVTLPAPQAVGAWRSWQSDVDVDHLDGDSQWLLPLLYVQLRAAGVPAPELERYANVYRHNWYKSQVRLDALGPVVAELRARGQAPVVVGGAGLALGYFPTVATRPFDCPTVSTSAVGAIDVTVGRVSFQVQGPVDALVQICADGGVNDPSTLLWPLDVLFASRRMDAQDWSRVWQRAKQLEFSEQVQEKMDWFSDWLPWLHRSVRWSRALPSTVRC